MLNSLAVLYLRTSALVVLAALTVDFGSRLVYPEPPGKLGFWFAELIQMMVSVYYIIWLNEFLNNDKNDIKSNTVYLAGMAIGIVLAYLLSFGPAAVTVVLISEYARSLANLL